MIETDSWGDGRMSWKWNYFFKYIKIIINNYKIHLGDIENSKEQDFWYEKHKQW